jgi:hypothetical protein
VENLSSSQVFSEVRLVFLVFYRFAMISIYLVVGSWMFGLPWYPFIWWWVRGCSVCHDIHLFGGGFVDVRFAMIFIYLVVGSWMFGLPWYPFIWWWVRVLFMLFLFFYLQRCPTWFPYPMMFNVAPFYNNTRSASSETETTYLSRAHEDPLFYWGWCCSIFSFLCNVLSSIVCLSGGTYSVVSWIHLIVDIVL